MRNRNLQRRTVLLTVPLLLLGGGAPAREKAKACLTAEDRENGLRGSLNYTDNAPDPAKRCSACAYFSERVEGCGRCAIFSGPASATGHCDSWSAKT